MEKESLRRNLGSVIMEASRRHLETARSLPEAPTWHSETPRRHPEGSQETPRRHPKHPKLQRPPRERNRNPSQLKCKSCFCFSISQRVLRVGVILYRFLQGKMRADSRDGNLRTFQGPSNTRPLDPIS